MEIASSAAAPSPHPADEDRVLPLVVDLDGTLLTVDLLVETYLELFAQKPLAALKTLGTLSHGKGALKASIADQIAIKPATLPLNRAVVALIQERRAAGGKVILASASDSRHVSAIADHLGLFDETLGSTSERNLSGATKAEALVARLGHGGFDYVGNARPATCATGCRWRW